ncbi:translocon subunit [Entophlyctis luteolus]|nr:translocon subunit [Entophlyctis luteolus]
MRECLRRVPCPSPAVYSRKDPELCAALAGDIPRPAAAAATARRCYRAVCSVGVIAASIKSIRSYLLKLPEFQSPAKKAPLGEKALWTLAAFAIFVSGNQIPLFLVPLRSAILRSSSNDALYLLRSTIAGAQNSVFDLGAAPLVFATVATHLLVGSHVLTLNHDSREERILLTQFTKTLAIGVTVIQALLSVLSGFYGSLGTMELLIVAVQLVFGSLIIIGIDELVQKGWAFGTGYALFVAARVTENLACVKSLGTEYEGACIALFHLFFARIDKFRALKEAFYRSNLPNISGLFVQLAVCGVVLYLASTRYEITLQHSKLRQHSAPYQIKLLHTSNVAVLAVLCLVGYYAWISQVMFAMFPENIVVRAFGVWKSFDNLPQKYASSGLAYFLTPPRTLLAAIYAPYQFVVYCGFIIFATVTAAQAVSDASGTTARDLSKMLEAQGLVIPGRREGSIYKELKKIVPQVTATGAILLVSIAVLGDFLGKFWIPFASIGADGAVINPWLSSGPNGSGMAGVMLVTTYLQYFEIGHRANMERGNDDLW